MVRRLEDRIKLHRRGDDGKPFALLFLDIDGFKAVNDHYGHEAGDRVLRAVGQRLQSQLREGDLVARWAGDEFLILLDDIAEHASLALVIDKLKQAFATPLDGVSTDAGGVVSVSVGASLYPDDGADVSSLVSKADAAMYRNKPAH
jgi:diguanylate cyclase (GGDEF)-like protein